MKKIAICGYTSAVGQYFVNKYKKEFEIVLLGRKNPDIFLDLTECKYNDDMEKLRGCDALINFAADTRSGTDEEILGLIKANVVGAVFLAQLAKKYDIPRFVHISSISATYDNSDPYYGYYAESKRSADAFLELYCKQNDISYCILRPSSLFGTEDFAKHQKFLYTLIDKVKNKQNVQIYGTLDAKRNYIHVDTLSEIVYEAINDNSVEGVFDAVNPKNDKVTEIIEALNKCYGGISSVEFLEDKPDIIERDFNSDGEIFDLLNIKKPGGIEGELDKVRRAYGWKHQDI